MSPNSISCTSWLKAHPLYNWTVDLSTYKEAYRHPEHFDKVIHPGNLREFENSFREAVDNPQDNDSYVIAGEVVYWKLYGNHMARNARTSEMLEYLTDPDNWKDFKVRTATIANEPNFDRFKKLQSACDQPRGFAVPITFLSFYRPSVYPMVDKLIAYWWKDHKDRFQFRDAPIFDQRDDGWIQTSSKKKLRQNWDTYLNWKDFCCQYAELISEQCNVSWRPRDIEMAVWMAWKNKISLSSL